jgi:hypothetical protein
VRMPPPFVAFFAAMAQVGATLIGLVFIAVSMRQTSQAPKAPIEISVLADATLFALADGFLVSSAAVHPALNTAYVALAMSALGLAWAALAGIHLMRERARNRSAALRTFRLRVVVPNFIGLLINVTQIDAGVRLLRRPGDEAATGLLASVVLLYFALALLRAWTLVGGAHFGPRATLSAVEPVRGLLRERRLPTWPHVHHGPRGGSPMSRPPDK